MSSPPWVSEAGKWEREAESAWAATIAGCATIEADGQQGRKICGEEGALNRAVVVVLAYSEFHRMLDATANERLPSGSTSAQGQVAAYRGQSRRGPDGRKAQPTTNWDQFAPATKDSVLCALYSNLVTSWELYRVLCR